MDVGSCRSGGNYQRQNRMFQQLSRHYRCFSHRLLSAATTATLTASARSMSTAPFYQLSAKDIKGQDFAFSQLQGKVVLVVNVASKVWWEYRGTSWPVAFVVRVKLR